MALILADTREDNGANPYLESYIADNNKHNSKLSYNMGGGDISLKIKQVTVGDYSILIKEKNSDSGKSAKTILAMVIERKTWKDLAASIKDGRINHQHENMHEIREEKGCHVLYIIEGNMSYQDDSKISNIPFKTLHAKIRHNTIRGIPFIQTKNEQHTAKMIVDLSRDILKMYRRGEIDFVKQNKIDENKEVVNNGVSDGNLLNDYRREVMEMNKKYRELFVHNGMTPNIIDEIDKIIQDAQNPKSIIQEPFDEGNSDFIIPENMTTRAIHADSDIILLIWNSLPNVSAKSAVMLMNKFHISDVVCVTGEDVEKIKNEISNLRFPSGMKFGDAKASRIMDLSYHGDDVLKKEKLYDLSVKIISKIPGLSESAAKVILENYSLRDICNGFVQADMISELRLHGNKNNRKISLKSAEKLVQLMLKPSIKLSMDALT